ncbi:MAG: phage tail family protein [Staphylococcus equorum]|nr:phage tail family protein [Staphylococcus equorum]
MYKFVDVNQMAQTEGLPSVAMEYDGLILEQEVKGYRTLTVKGREMLSVDIKTERPDGRDGTIVTGQSLPARELEITYKMEADSNEEFQLAYSLLMKKLLRYADVPIRFADEPDIWYYGRYASTSDIPSDINMVTASFTIYCQSSYKRKETVVLTGNPINVGYISDYAMKPDEIKLVIGAVATKITVDNLTTGRHIILNGSYAVGNTIKIGIPNNVITKNGQNIMKELDFTETDFHDFLINSGDSIKVTPNSTMEINLRGRKL